MIHFGGPNPFLSGRNDHNYNHEHTKVGININNNAKPGRFFIFNLGLVSLWFKLSQVGENKHKEIIETRTVHSVSSLNFFRLVMCTMAWLKKDLRLSRMIGRIHNVPTCKRRCLKCSHHYHQHHYGTDNIGWYFIAL